MRKAAASSFLVRAHTVHPVPVVLSWQTLGYAELPVPLMPFAADYWAHGAGFVTLVAFCVPAPVAVAASWA